MANPSPPGSPPSSSPHRGPGHRVFVERLLILALFVLVLGTLWYIRSLLVVLLGAIVLAALLRAVADPVSNRTGLGPRLATTVAIVLVSAVIAAAAWLFGSTINSQMEHISRSLPASWRELQQGAARLPFGPELLDSLRQALDPGTLLRQAVNLVGNAVSTLALIVFGAIFLAAQPHLYIAGLIKLVPAANRPLLATSLDDAGRALRLWMLGQVISMAVVGLLTGVGLWLAGVPSAVALGLISGLAEGIPYLGPIVGSIPGLLLALVEGPETALWALLVYVAVQQIEGNTLVPIIHRELVSLPPALTLFWIIAAGLVFGVIGVVFATPMLVLVYVLVKRLYIREALSTHTSIPGEPPP